MLNTPVLASLQSYYGTSDEVCIQALSAADEGYRIFQATQAFVPSADARQRCDFISLELGDLVVLHPTKLKEQRDVNYWRVELIGRPGHPPAILLALIVLGQDGEEGSASQSFAAERPRGFVPWTTLVPWGPSEARAQRAVREQDEKSRVSDVALFDNADDFVSAGVGMGDIVGLMRDSSVGFSHSKEWNNQQSPVRDRQSRSGGLLDADVEAAGSSTAAHKGVGSPGNLVRRRSFSSGLISPVLGSADQRPPLPPSPPTHFFPREVGGGRSRGAAGSPLSHPAGSSEVIAASQSLAEVPKLKDMPPPQASILSPLARSYPAIDGRALASSENLENAAHSVHSGMTSYESSRFEPSPEKLHPHLQKVERMGYLFLQAQKSHVNQAIASSSVSADSESDSPITQMNIERISKEVGKQRRLATLGRQSSSKLPQPSRSRVQRTNKIDTSDPHDLKVNPWYLQQRSEPVRAWQHNMKLSAELRGSDAEREALEFATLQHAATRARVAPGIFIQLSARFSNGAQQANSQIVRSTDLRWQSYVHPDGSPRSNFAGVAPIPTMPASSDLGSERANPRQESSPGSYTQHFSPRLQISTPSFVALEGPTSASETISLPAHYGADTVFSSEAPWLHFLARAANSTSATERHVATRQLLRQPLLRSTRDLAEKQAPKVRALT